MEESLEYGESLEQQIFFKLAGVEESEINELEYLLRKEVLGRGMSIDMPISSNGANSLHIASDWGNVGIMSRLLFLGAGVDVRDEIGRTPLHYACMNGNDDAVQLLLANHADVNAQTIGGDTPLIKAVQLCQVDIVKILWSRPGINIKTQNRLGQAALDIAQRYGHEGIVNIFNFSS